MLARHAVRTLACVALLHGLTIVTAAAQARYQFTADTLRYREITNQDMVMSLPQGPVTMQTTHEAQLAMRGTGAEAAEAWYESLSVELVSSAMRQTIRPATDAMLRKPFQLRITPRGDIVTRDTPVVPADLRSVSDLSKQFVDFLITLPTSALAIGTTWADTVSSVKPGEYDMRAIRSYRVARDTVIDGEAAVVIAVEEATETAMTIGQPQKVQSKMQLKGRDTGEAIFAPARGVLLHRVREGELQGQVEMTSDQGAMTMPQTIRYRTSLALAK